MDSSTCNVTCNTCCNIWHQVCDMLRSARGILWRVLTCLWHFVRCLKHCVSLWHVISRGVIVMTSCNIVVAICGIARHCVELLGTLVTRWSMFILCVCYVAWLFYAVASCWHAFGLMLHVVIRCYVLCHCVKFAIVRRAIPVYCIWYTLLHDVAGFKNVL